MDRPKGSKNKVNHKASGSRPNTDPKRWRSNQINNVLNYFYANAPPNSQSISRENKREQAEIQIEPNENSNTTTNIKI